MIATEFRTENLPAADRFASWHELACQAAMPTSVRSEFEADFPASMRVLDLGSVQLFLETFPTLSLERTTKLIRRSDPDQVHLVLYLSGKAGFSQAGRDTTITSRDLTLYNTWSPFQGWTCPVGGESCADIRVQIPRALLPLHPNAVDRLIARRLSRVNGLGALVSGCLHELFNNTDRYLAADAPRLATIVLDLVAALLAHEIDAENLLPPETWQQSRLASIQDFIQHNPGNPALAPDMIAVANHISIRYLHRIFQGNGLSVAGWIRQQRLERCHHDLADRRLSGQPIHAIAARWGFSDKAHFSRLFRATYGMPPRDYRQLAQSTTDAAPSGAAPRTGVPAALLAYKATSDQG